MRGVLAMSALVGVCLLVGATSSALTVQCIGDCDGDDFVRIGDLIVATQVVLGTQPRAACPGLDRQSGEVDVADVVLAINDAFNGCVVTHVDYVIGGTYNMMNEAGGVLSLDLVRRDGAVDHWAVRLSFSPHGFGGPGTVNASGTADYFRDAQLLTFDLQAQIGAGDPFALTGSALWEPPSLRVDALQYSYFESHVRLMAPGLNLDFIGINPNLN
jgi:hypothetical protein